MITNEPNLDYEIVVLDDAVSEYERGLADGAGRVLATMTRILEAIHAPKDIIKLLEP